MGDYLVCARVHDAENDPVVPGSVILECSNCAHKIWLAPSGQKMVVAEKLELLCMSCGMSTIADDPDPEIAPLTNEQKAEVRKALMDDA